MQELSGATIYLLGRLHGVPRQRLGQLVAAQGARLAAKPGAKVAIVAVGHSASARVAGDGRLVLPDGLAPGASLISERRLRRLLGLPAPPAAEQGHTAPDELRRLAGLTPSVLACLVLFDVVEPADGAYAYRDLVAAREVGRLLAAGVELRQVLAAAVALQRRGHHLSEVRLRESPAGGLAREIAGQLAELGGQYAMALSRPAGDVDDLLAAAEEAEAAGDFAAAERLYGTALRAEPSDPVPAFNLGNVLDAQGRRAEADIAWQMAAARDPAFADAWYNLAMAAEDQRRTALAVERYRRAVEAQADHADAHYNLALLLTRLERAEEALPHWERFLALQPRSPQAAAARRGATLCRLTLNARRSASGAGGAGPARRLARDIAGNGDCDVG